MMMMNINSKGLNNAFEVEKFEYNKDKTEEANSENREEEKMIKIANFAEELKDRKNYNGLDICFVIDATSSMASYIEGAKESVKTIIEDAQKSLKEMQKDEDSLQFAVVAYRDHPPQETTFVTKISNFTNAKTTLEFLAQEVLPVGGGDQAEAVMDGLYDALYNVEWRANSEKFLFLVLDSPPHGKRFNCSSDGFPDGCPCGHSEMTLLPKMREMKIDFTILKVTDQVNTMIELFSQYVNVDVFQPSFLKKSNAPRSGTAYTEEIKTSMKACISNKVNTNLNCYKK
jgi:hypothetical protein